jgi:hypothetical protein
MAFVAEDGTGLANANSLVSVANADEILTDRGDPEGWSSLALGEKQAALIAGTDLVNTRKRWPGSILVSTQALAYPRKDARDADGRELVGVPQAVKVAVCLAAVEHLREPLDVALERGGMVTAEKVGSIAVDYSEAAPGGRTFPNVDRALAPITGGGSQPHLERA